MALITEAALRAMLRKGIPDPYSVSNEDKLTPAAADFLKERGITLKVDRSSESAQASASEVSSTRGVVPVGVSNRHVHLSREDVITLFGTGYELTPLRELSQPGQFAAKEQVILCGPKGVITHVRVLGPSRGATQVEISKNDEFQLGIRTPVRLSGSIEDTPGITLCGPKGCIFLDRGLIVAKCHVHMSPEDAAAFDVNHGDRLMLQSTGERPIVFPDVVVRVSPNFRLEFHVDFDEANAAGLKTGETVKIVGKNDTLIARPGGEEAGYQSIR